MKVSSKAGVGAVVLGVTLGAVSPAATAQATAPQVVASQGLGGSMLVQAKLGEGSESTEVMAERRKSQIEQRAEVLLDRAVAHIREKGREGAKDFSRSPDFIDRDLYAFAISTDGVMLGSGGWSAPLVGQNVLNELDAQGRPFFKEMLQQAQQHGKAQVSYHWYNPASSEATRKTTNVERVGDVVVGVGFYVERASRTDAKRMLRRAVDALRTDAAAAMPAFQQETGPYIKDDLYVFVVDTRDGRFLAHGGSPALVNTNAFDLLDAAGRKVVREMFNAARDGGDGTLDYLWINPMTGRIESKRTYFTLEKHFLVGVGSYNLR